MRPGCWQPQALMSRRAQGLEESERLWLEEHLGKCDRCAGDAAVLERMRAAVHEHDADIGTYARRRTLARAFRATDTPTAEVVIAAGKPPRLIVLAAALLLGVAVALLVSPWRGSARTFALGPAGASMPGWDTAAAPAPTPEHSVTLLDAPVGARLELDDAVVQALSPVRVRWRASEETVELLAGAVSVELPPRPGRRFRVATSHFVVEVVGTAFDVDSDTVSVHRGQVRVHALDTDETLADLAAGQTWVWSAAKKETGRPPADASNQLASVRRLIADGKTARARSALGELLARPLTPRQRAEARSLLAECALVEGDYASAARAYGEVADQHGNTLAGENALFAKGRAQMGAGQKANARRTFQQYLQRYPKGRFRKEALAHIRTLGESK